jgi:hypothetical protein
MWGEKSVFFLTTTDIYYSFPTEDFSPSSKSDISNHNQKISALGNIYFLNGWLRKVVVTFFQWVKFIFLTTMHERTNDEWNESEKERVSAWWSEKLISQIGKILQRPFQRPPIEDSVLYNEKSIYCDFFAFPNNATKMYILGEYIVKRSFFEKGRTFV